MSRKTQIAGVLVLAAVLAMSLTSSGRLIGVYLLGSLFFPLWALLLASVFLIVCLALGGIIFAVALYRDNRPAPAAAAPAEQPKAA